MAGAFLQRRASEAKAEQWRAAAARLLRAVGGEEKRNGTASAFGRRAGWLQGTAATPGGARRVASATASRRRATHTRPAFSENGRYCSFDSVKMISLTAKIDSVGSLKP